MGAIGRRSMRCGKALTSWGGSVGGAVSRPATASVTRSSSSCHWRQLESRRYWSAPMTRNHYLGPLGLQRSHGVDGVARAGAVELAAVEHEARLTTSRGLDHGGAMRAAGELARLLPRLSDGDPVQLVEAQMFERGARERDVRDMRRIEAAAEQADARGAAQHHCLTRKNSLYSRASGEPGSGCQS